MKRGALLHLVPLSLLLAGCTGTQSVLDPAGKDASVLADLFWVLLMGAVVLWLAINGLFFYVTRIEPRSLSRRLAETLVIGGGIVFPFFLLSGLLIYALSIMPDQKLEGTGALVRVTGEQWWWRVEYITEPIVAANEIRLPVDHRTEIKLGADKFIHSFWIPALAGKMDMFPGRETRLAVEPSKVGVYRGQCAEFCGEAHALMSFQAVVLEQDDFAVWLEKERQDAIEPATDLARQGEEIFFEEGCGACHAVRGTEARGQTGPDLTHVGGRLSLGAGILPTDRDAFVDWIRHTKSIKPGVKMPPYVHLSEDKLLALGAYLEGLK
ncbi:heme/copper-type cytochrome/quinol oxidase, subunit 2 [Hoeflea sp. IMCC20628]|uniref:cytochrome c oxidase subunit II n=1 Tax=Hoeflea sp. IMCC20628 TaxID=1620421 RepID=UPI00063AF216|nr:c-type cytochrome [Hoeflea sp. IMCC20628]AKH98888.1 heme/copper-type cytochrome/quinol oxidase, subunit 2 [Hoeflea sp. IMCC20628]